MQTYDICDSKGEGWINDFEILIPVESQGDKQFVKKGKNLKTGYMNTATFKTNRQEKGFTLALFALLAMLIFLACEKADKIAPQQPGNPTDTTAYLQLSVSGLQLSGSRHYALVSIDSKAGQPVVTNKKITLDEIQGVYKTDKIELEKGEYNITKFIVVNASDTALYAAPKANTPKAAAVAKPLSITVAITSKGINSANVEALKLAETDMPASYGYTADDFGYHAYISLNVTLKINVGQVAYDSLPGKLKISATADNGSQWIRELDMQRGITSIKVPEQYSTYQFEVGKWNTVARKTLNRAGVTSHMVIDLEASRQPKRLVEEKVFIENSAATVPDSRTEFYYSGTNKLAEIRNYQKQVQQSGLVLTNVYKFRYEGNLLDSINRFNRLNNSTGYTAFFYNNGKIESISNLSYDQHTGVAFEYNAAGENETISGDYIFHNGNTMFYRFFTRNGNRISEQALTSTGGSESGVYEYDDNINPKHQLGWDDIFFTNYSKNNKLKEQKNYGGSFPTAVPYKFEYVYDNDGYPAEEYVSYKGYTSQQHLYRIKKVYIYQ